MKRKKAYARFQCASRVFTPNYGEPTVVELLTRATLAQSASQNGLEKERHLCIQLSYCSTPVVLNYLALLRRAECV